MTTETTSASASVSGELGAEGCSRVLITRGGGAHAPRKVERDGGPEVALRAHRLAIGADRPAQGCGMLRTAHARLRRLRLPVPLDRRRRRALAARPRRARSPREGHDVTYLTRRQWDDGDEPDLPGVARRGGRAARAAVRRRRQPPHRPAAALRPRRPAPPPAPPPSYDAVHTCSFPYFSLLAARLALAGTGTQIGVDWFEVWSRRYWTRYLGPVAGTIGWLVQRLCVRLTRRAFVFSRCTPGAWPRRGCATSRSAWPGSTRGALEPPSADRATASRWWSSPGATSPRSARRWCRRRSPSRASGCPGCAPSCSATAPSASRSSRPRPAHGLRRRAGLRRRRGGRRHDGAARTCLLLPSSAARATGWSSSRRPPHGTPTVVVAGEDNAAVELVEDGVNGFVARSEAPEDVADAIVALHDGGDGAARARPPRGSPRRARELSGRRARLSASWRSYGR